MNIVWANGCFDVLHRGHIELFKYSKSFGDLLYVGIDSDRKVKQDKGYSRPFNVELDRKFLLESIKYIDKVFIFDSKHELENLIRTLSPSVMVVGSDWKGKDVVGSKYAGALKFFNRIPNYSTTKILNEKT